MCPPNHRWKYSVFLSFSGTDVRTNFISHLYKDLSEIWSDVFIDYRVEPAEKITPILMQAIEESRIAVIIFSKSYASSTWCLDELEKIIKCQLDVIPIFYLVDAAHVYDPTISGGVYAKDFARYEKRFKGFKVQGLKKTLMKRAQRWKDAMRKVANFKGFDLQGKDIRSEAELVDKIVKHVSDKLIRISPRNIDDLVGRIDLQIEDIKELLRFRSEDVRLLGICGMPGIGKTTIVKILYKQIWSEFEVDCILENIRQELESSGGSGRLRQELHAKILGKYMMSAHSHHLKPTISRKTALVILDDLTNLQQLEDLIGDIMHLFGRGSRIIITSIDKEMFGKKGILGESVHVIDPYEVRELSYDDSVKLFCQYAFERGHPIEDFMTLVESFVNYCGRVPLALKVLGRYLLGKPKERWETSLANLENGPPQDIQRVLKFRYDDLTWSGKEMFLDIACFLCGETFHVVEKMFERCKYSMEINDLIDKYLITKSSDNRVRIHSLLQEMGRQIEREKSKYPSKRMRLWDHDDVCETFKGKIVCESIESISLDMSKTKEGLQLDRHAFEKMPNLKFLRFYTSKDDDNFMQVRKVHLEANLECLPDKLIYLHWYRCPLESLAANFDTKNLVVLTLPYSDLKKLWQGDKDLENLITFDLSHSGRLDEMPSLSRASNLRRVILKGCTNLDKVPSSIACLNQLTCLDLSNCRGIRSLPSTMNLKFLEKIILDGCSNLDSFPEVSSGIRILSLNGTAIEEIPLSIGSLGKLHLLSFKGCPKLRHVPFIVLKLNLLTLFMEDLPKLSTFAIPETMCCLLEDQHGTSVADLFLDGISLVSLPDSFKQLSRLRRLYIVNCHNLYSLPELPPNLQVLHASNCKSLETISSIKGLFISNCRLITSQEFCFINCPKLDEKNCRNLAPDVVIRAMRTAVQPKDYQRVNPFVWSLDTKTPYFTMCYPGNEIPEIFNTHSDEGRSSITIELPRNRHTPRLLGFMHCVVFYPGSRVHCECHFQIKKGESIVIKCSSSVGTFRNDSSSMIVALWYDYNFDVDIAKKNWFSESCDIKVTFEYFSKDIYGKRLGVEKCGIHPLYAKDDVSNSAKAALMWMNPSNQINKHHRFRSMYKFFHMGVGSKHYSSAYGEEEEELISGRGNEGYCEEEDGDSCEEEEDEPPGQNGSKDYGEKESCGSHEEECLSGSGSKDEEGDQEHT